MGAHGRVLDAAHGPRVLGREPGSACRGRSERPRGTSTTSWPPPPRPLPVEGAGAGRQGRRGRRGPRRPSRRRRRRTRQRASSSTSPRPKPASSFQEKGGSLGRDALDAEGVPEEGGTVAVRDVDDPVPPVDEAVEGAAASRLERDAQRPTSRFRREAAAHGRVEDEGFAVDQEAARSSGSSPATSCVHEKEFAHRADTSSAHAPRGRRVRGDGGQGEAGLREELRVADLGRPPGKISRTGGARKGRAGEEQKEKGEVSHVGGWGRLASIRHPS